jgi:hypothetical protein
MWRPKPAIIIGLLALLLAGCAPLAITSVKIVDEGCDCACLSWETNQAAVCKVTYCEGTMCYTSPMEPDYSTLHSIGIPPGSKDVTITAIGRSGQSVSIGIQP